MIKIAHIVNLGGPNPWLNGVADHHDRGAFQHIVINVGGRSGLHEALEARGITTYALDAASRRQYPRALARLTALLRREAPTIVQTHTFDPTTLGLAAAQLPPRPRTLLTRHHADFTTLFDKPIHRQIDRGHALLADHVWAPSRFIARCMEEHERVPTSKIHILPHAFDFEAMRPTLTREARRELRASIGGDDRFLVGMVARLAVEKSHETLLDAVATVRAERPDVLFVIVGDGPRRAELEAYAASLGIMDSVRFLGWRWDAWNLIEAMDLIAHPSLREPFGIIYVEAMALERAVVTTDDGAAPEILDDGETGVILPPRSSRALARAILELASTPERCAAMGALARRRAIEKYAFPTLIARYEDYYRRVAA